MPPPPLPPWQQQLLLLLDLALLQAQPGTAPSLALPWHRRRVKHPAPAAIGASMQTPGERTASVGCSKVSQPPQHHVWALWVRWQSPTLACASLSSRAIIALAVLASSTWDTRSLMRACSSSSKGQPEQPSLLLVVVSFRHQLPASLSLSLSPQGQQYESAAWQ